MTSRKDQMLACAVGALLVSGAGMATPAAAQRPPSAPAGSPAGTNSDPAPAGNDIIVTATKRPQSLRDVPLSITAVTADQLSARGIQSFGDLARVVPGIIQSGNSSFSKFAVRGIQTSNTTSSSGSQRSVAVYLDDVPLTSFAILTPEISPYDVSRVEVLRGPQGTLFGSGTLAGAVRFITNKPNLNRFGLEADGDLGVTKADGHSYRRRISGVVNAPIIDHVLGARLVAYYRNEDGWISNVVTGKKNADSIEAYGVRGSLRWRPTEAFTATLMVTKDHNNIGDSSAYNRTVGFQKANSRIPFSANIDLATYNGTLEYDAGFATITSSTTYAKSRTNWSLDLNNATTLLPLYLNERVRANSVVEDFRVVSKPGKDFDWVIGAFYLNQKSPLYDAQFTTADFLASKNITGLTAAQSPGIDLSNNNILFRNLEEAIYGELSWHLSEKLTATVGLRETRYRFSSQQQPGSFSATGAVVGAILAGGNRVIGRPPIPAVLLTTGLRSRLTQKYNLTWKPARNQTYYLLASEGFRRGHPNSTALINGGRSPTDPTDPTIIPLVANADKLWNFEVGAKFDAFQRRLSASLAAYYIPWGPIQVDLVRPSDGQPFVGNVGKVISKGVEAEIVATPTPLLHLGMRVTIQSSKVTKLTADEAKRSGALIGSPLASPKFQIGGSLQKDWEVGQSAKIFARADVLHVSSYPNSFPNSPGRTTPSPNYFINEAYENVDLAVGYETTRGRLSLYAENVFNDQNAININASGSSSNRFRTLRPRTIGFRFNVKY